VDWRTSGKVKLKHEANDISLQTKLARSVTDCNDVQRRLLILIRLLPQIVNMAF
jgi:hypothetical protein